MNKVVNIIAVETSPLIEEGLSGILNRAGIKCQLLFVNSLEEAEISYLKKRCQLIIVNPALVLNNLKTYNALKSQLEKVKWIGLVYAYYEGKILSLFDALISISDTPEIVAATINKLLAEENQSGINPALELTDRENEVLGLLATGMTNKAIADKLNISTNTVITHRKNISQKTGIKSVSGLTIFAVVQKLVTIDMISE